jgi:hypothetical protein
VAQAQVRSTQPCDGGGFSHPLSANQYCLFYETLAAKQVAASLPRLRADLGILRDNRSLALDGQHITRRNRRRINLFRDDRLGLTQTFNLICVPSNISGCRIQSAWKITIFTRACADQVPHGALIRPVSIQSKAMSVSRENVTRLVEMQRS